MSLQLNKQSDEIQKWPTDSHTLRNKDLGVFELMIAGNRLCSFAGRALTTEKGGQALTKIATIPSGRKRMVKDFADSKWRVGKNSRNDMRYFLSVSIYYDASARPDLHRPHWPVGSVRHDLP